MEREEGGDWECDQGQGRVTLSLTVLSRGKLDWLGENLTGLERRNIRYQHSVENVVLIEGEEGSLVSLVAGQDYSVRCVATNMTPDGLFVWRLEDVTINNPRPLLILSDGEGWRSVSQEIVFTAGEEQRGER